MNFNWESNVVKTPLWRFSFKIFKTFTIRGSQIEKKSSSLHKHLIKGHEIHTNVTLFLTSKINNFILSYYLLKKEFPKNILRFVKRASPNHGRLCFNITEAIWPPPAVDVRKHNDSLMTFLPSFLVVQNARRFQRVFIHLPTSTVLFVCF